MKFHPCIDIHNGEVKQIVGSTLTTTDETVTTTLSTNFTSPHPPSYFAKIYKSHSLTDGHVILLGTNAATLAGAQQATRAYPNQLQVGGGVSPSNALDWIQNQLASKVIITSYAFDSSNNFQPTKINEVISALSGVGGRARVVLDLSCRKKDSSFYVVTNKWQTFTSLEVKAETFVSLSKYCSGFLVHGVDVEGKRCGVIEELVKILGEARKLLIEVGNGNENGDVGGGRGGGDVKITYAGGINSLEDIATVEKWGGGQVDFTVGSGLSLFGGEMDFEDVVRRFA